LLLAGCLESPRFGASIEAQLRDTSGSTGVSARSSSNQTVDVDADGGTSPEPTEPVAAAQPGAAGAGALTGPDDSVRCGNGVVDETELCDVAIDQGEPGACPLSCDTSDPCKPFVLLVHGCSTHCAPAAPARGAACP
ncbi:MAG: hypothetical protein ACHQ53_05370, partial [Polyangiales bacterium]